MENAASGYPSGDLPHQRTREKTVIAKPRPGRGQPTRYKPEYSDQAKKLCELGATCKELAEAFGVDRKTIRNWQVANPEFRQAIEAGRRVALGDGPSFKRAIKAAVEAAGVSATVVSQANAIVRYAPDLVEPLLGDAMSFNHAVREAVRRRKAASQR